ncbi:MAG: endolytic transglycosylase MltG [Pseudomonadota bacterium]
MWKHLVANVMTLMIIGLVVVGGVLAWGRSEYAAQGPLDAAICLQVESGSTMRRVSEDLAEQGAISNGAIFRMGADYSGKSDALKAGSFLVPQGASMADITEIVTAGGRSTCGTEIVFRVGVSGQDVLVRELDPVTNRFAVIAEFDPATGETNTTYEEMRGAVDTRYRISLAEGVTSWQVVEALKSADFLEGTVEDIPPEGALAPDSYEVTVGTSVLDLLGAMEARQDARLAETWQNRVEGLPIATPEEALILASIIEKETALPEERRTVASVFVNRLRQGMRLQTDPTVIYGVTEGRGALGRGIRQSELRDDNPWNTYVIDGLPVTPIANPGLESLKAAVDPEETELLFFVADGTGGHAFAKTLTEHNENVAKWREIEANQGDSN